MSATGVDKEPSEAMLMQVVVAFAGRDLVDAPCFLVSWREGFRCCLEESRREVEEDVTLDATFLATEMLSRATSVTGAALDALETAGQVPGYQFYVNGPCISYKFTIMINLIF